MKALASLHRTFSSACIGALILFSPCSPAQQSGSSASDTRLDPAAFADVLSPSSEVPCHTRMPTYNELQPEKGARGSVQITYVVNTAGRVDLAIIDQSSGYKKFDDAARNGILQATCAPYVVDGVAHRVVQHVTINFVPAPAPDGLSATASPPSHAISRDEALKQMNIAPDSAKATMVEHWAQRMSNDPDIRRLLGPDSARLAAATPLMRNAFFADGELRLSPEDRSKLVELTLNGLDNAPADCGGDKRQMRLIAQNLQLDEMSDQDVATFLDIRFTIVKQTALGTPPALVTEDQRSRGTAVMIQTLQRMLQGDADATQDVLDTVSGTKAAQPEVWCKDARIFFRAVLATPQPFRDWMILSGDTRSKARRVIARGNAKIETSMAPSIASVVLERVTRNVPWPATAFDAEATVTIRCAPTGALLSASISRTSGNATWDAAVMQAVEASSPFPVHSDDNNQMMFNITLRSAAG
jgi:TonB family protein